jgi:hypothetical protein
VSHQLDDWTEKAAIPTGGRKHRVYGVDAVETVLLIEQARAKGLSLPATIDGARRFKEAPPGA